MDPQIVVMIVMLALPNGESNVQVKPMPDVEKCVAEANIEASDPFVQHVECSELSDGLLQLHFRREDEGAPKKGASQVGRRAKG